MNFYGRRAARGGARSGAPLPYSFVVTALQGQTHPALSDARPRCLAALLLSASLFTAVPRQNKRCRSACRAAGFFFLA